MGNYFHGESCRNLFLRCEDMEKVYGHCCGIDVHKDKLAVCLRKNRKTEMREFSTTTTDLLKLSDWLRKEECEMVAMESTGSYWKSPYNILEAEEIPVMLVNAAHMKNVPGRKTDTKDAEWIADLLQHGLLKPSFVPDRIHRELREMLTYRRSLRDAASSELNRVQKVLQGANIKLSSFIRDINGKSGRALLRDLLENGAPSCEHLEELKEKKLVSKQLKASTEELCESLNGALTDNQRQLLTRMLNHVDYLEQEIMGLDKDIDDVLDPHEKLAVEMLQTIPGVAEDSARTIVGIIGTDMDQFPTDAELCSWAAVCPGNNESAGKRKSGKTRKGNKLLKKTLTICAQAAAHTKNTFFSARYKRLRSRMSGKKAIMAIAHSMLRAIWHMLRTGELYRDLGDDFYENQDREHEIEKLTNRLHELRAGV